MPITRDCERRIERPCRRNRAGNQTGNRHDEKSWYARTQHDDLVRDVLAAATERCASNTSIGSPVPLGGACAARALHPSGNEDESGRKPDAWQPLLMPPGQQSAKNWATCRAEPSCDIDFLSQRRWGSMTAVCNERRRHCMGQSNSAGIGRLPAGPSAGPSARALRDRPVCRQDSPRPSHGAL